MTRTANLFTSIGGERPGVAYLLPTLVETRAVLWGAETGGPLNSARYPSSSTTMPWSQPASGLRVLHRLGR